MKQLFLSFLTIIFLLTASVALGETVDRQRLVERNGFVYKNFSPVPFTGKVTGRWSGKIVDGRKIGLWKTYWLNGSLASEGKYGDVGQKVGVWKVFNGEGHLFSKYIYLEEELKD